MTIVQRNAARVHTPPADFLRAIRIEFENEVCRHRHCNALSECQPIQTVKMRRRLSRASHYYETFYYRL